MTEETEKEKAEKEQQEEDNRQADLKKDEEIIAETNKAAERLEVANKEHKDLQLKDEVEKTNKMLGGESEAGQEQKPQTKDEKITAEVQAKFPNDLLPENMKPKAPEAK